MAKTFNTYMSVSFMSYANAPHRNFGSIYITNKPANLQVSLSISYEEAKREMAKLMLRTGEKPHVVGKEDNDGVLMYILTAFLD